MVISFPSMGHVELIHVLLPHINLNNFMKIVAQLFCLLFEKWIYALHVQDFD